MSNKELWEGFVSAAQRKAVWASKADGGKGHPDNKKKKSKNHDNLQTVNASNQIPTNMLYSIVCLLEPVLYATDQNVLQDFVSSFLPKLDVSLSICSVVNFSLILVVIFSSNKWL